MSKNQEDNATYTSKEQEEFLARLDNSQAELEKKSVEEIKKLSTLKLAQYFCYVRTLIIKHQEYNQTHSDPSFSEKQKHDSDIYLTQHSKPDIDKFITAFNTLKSNILQLQQYDSLLPIFNQSWTKAIVKHINNLQDLTHKNLEDIYNTSMVHVALSLDRLLDSSLLQEALKAQEMIIKSKGNVTNFTEEEKTAIATIEKKLTTTFISLSHENDYLKKEEKALEQQLHGEDVTTTGSSNLEGDDLP